MAKAIYAFSGDPIHYGHIDIIKRAGRIFDEVIVGIGENPDKKYMFGLEERMKMAEKSLEGVHNARVTSFKGLLVDYAYEQNIPAIIKAIRNNSDTEYEKMLHQAGESQKLNIDTFLLFARPELSHISSSAVKAVQKEHGMIHEYVPLHVKQALESCMSGQYIIGITGEIGAGKSYISQKFLKIGKAREIKVHNIEIDQIGHQILEELREPIYQKTRKEIIRRFGKAVELGNGYINRKALGEIVFNNPEKLKELNRIMEKPIEVRLKRELYGKKGIILLNAALIAESEMAYLCNNNVVLVTADKKSQQRRLRERGLNQKQIERRLKSQYNSKEKREKLEKIIKKDNHGKIWVMNNSDGLNESKKIFEEIVAELMAK